MKILEVGNTASVFVRNSIRGSDKRTDTTERNPGEWEDYGRGQDRDKAVYYEDDLQFAGTGAGNKVSSRSC